MSAPVMSDEEFARIVGPHPVREGEKIRRAKVRCVFFRSEGDTRYVGESPGTIIAVDEHELIVRWDNTKVRRRFRLRDEGRLWVRVPLGPDVLLSPSPWVPPREPMGCCRDRKYADASHSCTEHTCMHLPIIGQTCSDCVHVEKCTTIFGQSADDTYCQWFPRRFQSAAVDGARQQRTG